MSKHRIKSFAREDDYDDDFDDDYDGDGGDAVNEQGALSKEDEERLRAGTVQVRRALGAGYASIAEKEIQDTLWHYYYDVAKSVTYLKNQNTSSQKKLQKVPQPSKPRVYRASHPPNIYYLATPTARELFGDCPWLNIPRHRKTEILVEPLLPRLGLLGGSATAEGKMSKIAALAARRRQKENEKQGSRGADKDILVEQSASSLSKLREATKKTPASTTGSAFRQSQRRETKAAPLTKAPQQTGQNETDQRIRVAEQAETTTPTRNAVEMQAEQAESTTLTESATAIQAEPSAFARVLLHPHHIALPSVSTMSASLPDPAIFFDFTQPSPDDVVLRAQGYKALGPKTPNHAKQPTPTSSKELISNDLQDLSLKEPERIKGKNLDVLAEYRKMDKKNAANFVVIGHVDSGKSTLMGRLLYDLKAIDARDMEAYKKEAEKIGKGSFALAWILDQGTEERARGVTIDIAVHNFETERTSFTILDAPGHRDFVPNMIGGASEADFAVLVIDASEGEFEAGLQGQTKEHALLVRSMGVSRIILAVNKMDRIGWSNNRFEEIIQQMVVFLTTAGFKEENVSLVPCSGLAGDNVLRKSTNPQASWYTGMTLVEELDRSEPITRALDKPLRMTIGSISDESTQNALWLSGRIDAGAVQIGDQIAVMPSGEHAYIKSILTDEKPSDWAVAGQNVALSVTEIDEEKIRVGHMVCSSASPVENVSSFTAKVLAFDHLTPMPLVVHRGYLKLPGRISRLIAVLDKVDGKVLRKKPQVVHPGSTVRVMVKLEEPVPIDEGRIILRANGETVAAGFVE